MNPRILLPLVALTYGVTGMALLFAPLQVAPWLGFASGPALEAALQLGSAGLLGFAMLNWMGRGAVYGGIYGQPLVVANFGFAAVAAPTLFRMQLADSGHPVGWTLSVIVAAVWVAYGWLLHSKPWLPPES